MKKYITIAVLFICHHAFSQTTSSSVQEDANMTYNSDNFVSTQKKTQSNGDVLAVSYQYPKDITPTTGCSTTSVTDMLGLLNLVSKNIINTPVEMYTSVTKPSGSVYVTEATLFTYEATLPYPSAMYKLQTQIPLSSFVPYIASGCTLTKDVNYALEESYDLYDNYGNLLEKKTKGGKYISYVYSYKGTYKIAVVDNAQNNQIAYSSFETADMGLWTYASAGVSTVPSPYVPIAGNGCYNLSTGGTISRTLPAGNYIVSFWALNPSSATSLTVQATNGGTACAETLTNGPTINVWTYYEYSITSAASITISGNTDIDELRLYPQSAQMETIGYNPIIGMSYSCDIANHLTYYSYDDLGRLQVIKDQDGNVTKKMEYGIKKIE